MPQCNCALLVFISACSLLSASESKLSPANWPIERREAAEQRELDAPRPKVTRSVYGSKALVSATVSPIAVEAGIQALGNGGTAADAAAVIVLTQVATSAGSIVSYAGILELIYYDAAKGETRNLNAPWKNYFGETGADKKPALENEADFSGRRTRVPGFMAAIEAMHEEYGALEWRELFEPAIWYTENGVPVSRMLAGLFKNRSEMLSRSPEGHAFLYQGKKTLPEKGERFFQPQTAKTLRAIAHQGSQYMYQGEWAKRFVAAVNKVGGKASLDDLKSYQAIWQDTFKGDFAGHTIHVSGERSEGGYQLLLALNLASAIGLLDMPPYWESPESFHKLNLASIWSEIPAQWMANRAGKSGISLDLNDRAKPEYAEQIVSLFQSHLSQTKAPNESSSEHTDALVVVDQRGNIAALTHSINSAPWGPTGIVVDGIPITGRSFPDPSHPSGEYVRNGLSPAIVFKEDKPVFALSSLGGGQRRETFRILLGVIGKGMDISTVMDAPQWLVPSRQGNYIAVSEGSYSEAFLSEVEDRGLIPEVFPQDKARRFSGAASFVTIDPETGQLESREDERFHNLADGL